MARLLDKAMNNFPVVINHQRRGRRDIDLPIRRSKIGIELLISAPQMALVHLKCCQLKYLPQPLLIKELGAFAADLLD